MSEQKWREVYELVEGNCWHKVEEFTGEIMGHFYFKCLKCDLSDENNVDGFPLNPPLTLDALFEVAEKLGWSIHLTDQRYGRTKVILFGKSGGGFYKVESKATSQLALLNALHRATGHRRK